MPAPVHARDLPNELAAILAQSNAFAGAHYDNARQFNGAYTDLNLANYGTAVNGAAGLMHSGWQAANPDLVNYTRGLQGVMDGLNQNAPAGYNPTGYDAAVASPTIAPTAALATASRARVSSAGPAALGRFDPATGHTANASLASQQAAAGGPLLQPLEGDAMSNLGRVSRLQQQQEGIAGSLLDQGGNLSGQELRNVQQDTRGAFAARGMYDSNSAIGAEILNTDAARRNRLKENLGIAQGVDAAGQQQIGANRGYALGVQGQGQGLSTFNAGQGNQMGMANASLLTDTSRFNAGLLTQNSQFNAGRSADMSLANAGMSNNMRQFDTAQRNAGAQFNAGMETDVSRYNAGAQNNMGQFGASLLQNNNQFNATANNRAQEFNVGAVNDAGRFNTTVAMQNGNDQWGRAMQLGGMHLAQAQDPNRVAGALMGQAPDYSGSLLGYGGDLNNTNYNAIEAAKIAAGNNSAAKTAGWFQLGSSLLGGAARVKGAMKCVPEGQRIDTPGGGVCIENLRAGNRVIGFNGFPVFVLQKHEYMEDANQHRFVCIEFEGGGNTLTVCDRHRVAGKPAAEWQTGDVIGGRRVKSKTWHGGVRRSYDILTSDAGYRIAGVPVNSMIEELAQMTAKLMEKQHAI